MSLRSLYLQNAVNQCEPPITLERVSALLPPDFNLDQGELDAVLAGQDGSALPSETTEATDHLSERSDAEVIYEGERGSNPNSNSLAHKFTEPPTVAAAKQRLDEARVGVRALSDKLRVARGRFADCLQRYMRSRNAAAPTPDELRRDFCKQEMESRKARAGTFGPKVPQGQPGPSKLDRSRFYNGKGSAATIDDFGAVSGTGSARGAFPASQRGRRLRPAGA